MAIQKIPNTLIADNAITATKIANGTLTADDIAANSITAAKLSASTSPTFGGLTVNSSEVLFDNTGGDFTLKLNTNAVSDKNEIIMGDTGTPLAKFGVGGTANDIITGSDGQDFNIGTAGGGRAINFSTDNFASVEMKLDGGNLGIGTTNPSTSLHIKKSGANGSYGRSPVDSNLIIENTDTSVTESGYLILSGYMGNTTSQYQTAAIGGGKQEAAGNGFYGGYLNFWTTSGGGNGEANSGQYERMRIDQTGNVGIGTTSPNAKLDILGATSDQLRLRTAESEEYKIGRNSSTGLLDFSGTQSNYTGYTFGGVDGERMRIHPSGAIQLSAAASVSGVISRTTAPSGSQGLNITASVITGLPLTTPTFADTSSSGASIYLGGNAVDQYGGSIILKAYGAGADGNLIVFENRSGTNTFKQTMRIGSNGNVTKPLQCNFLARRSGDQTGYNASGSYGDGVRYNSEIYDIGGDFDVTTGIFTAPVDGTYLIQGSVYSNTSGTTWTQAWLAINNARAEYTDMMGNDGDTFISTTHLVKLSAGDEVRYHPYYSGSTNVTILANNNHTWFKGYLLG